MTEAIGEAALRDGRPLQIIRVTAPEREWASRVLKLVSGKGALWRSVIRQALESGLGDLEVCFYLAVIGDDPVGNVTVHRSPPPDSIGMILNVFTEPSYRRQGVAKALTQAALGDFEARGGRSLYLTTRYGGAAFRLYLQCGFEAVGESGDMRWRPSGLAEEPRFAERPATIREVAWRDWPALHALYLTEEGSYLRSLHFYQWGRCGYEGEFPLLMAAMASGGVRGSQVLVTDTGVVVGHAYLARQPAWPTSGAGYFEHLKRLWAKLRWVRGDVPKLRSLSLLVPAMRLIRTRRACGRLLEFFVHPNFSSRAAQLLGSVGADEDGLWAVADSEAPERAALLEAVGMERAAMVPRIVPRAEDFMDLNVFRS